MQSIPKYIKQKSADGTVFKVTLATLVSFNLAYLLAQSISQYAVGEKINFNFLKDITDPKTYSYVIASSIMMAVLISSFIFYKVKTKQLSFSDEESFNQNANKTLCNDKQDKIEKVTIGFGNNGIMIMPDQNVIEIPIIHYLETDEANDNLFKEVSFTAPSFWSNKNKSIYHAMNLEKLDDTLEEIVESKIFFFNKKDLEPHIKGGFTAKCKDDNFTLLVQNGEIKISTDKSFQFADLYHISSMKIYYDDCSSMKLKLKLKEEQPADADVELCEYVMANRHIYKALN